MPTAMSSRLRRRHVDRPHGRRIDVQDTSRATDVGHEPRLQVQSLRAAGNGLGVKAAPAIGHPEASQTIHEPNEAWSVIRRHLRASTHGKGEIRVLLKFDQKRHRHQEPGWQGQRPGEFDLPHSLVFDAQGSFYIAPQPTPAQVLTAGGAFIRESRHPGTPEGVHGRRPAPLAATGSRRWKS